MSVVTFHTNLDPVLVSTRCPAVQIQTPQKSRNPQHGDHLSSENNWQVHYYHGFIHALTPKFWTFPHKELLARSIAASKSSDCSGQRRCSHRSVGLMQANMIVYTSDTTEVQRLIQYQALLLLVLQLPKSLTREHLQALAATVNIIISIQMLYFYNASHEIQKMLIMQRKAFSFYRFRPQSRHSPRA